MADHQGHRSESRGQPIEEVGDPPAQRVEKRPVERHCSIPRSRRRPLWRMMVTTGGIALSESEKGETHAHNLETQFQPVNNPSAPAITEMVEVALRSYFLSPTNEPQFKTLMRFTKPSGVSRLARLRGRNVSRTGH